jgi:molybdenum cofactor biosynthesis protein B
MTLQEVRKSDESRLPYESAQEECTTSGAAILDFIRETDHELLGYQVVPDDPATIQRCITVQIEAGANVILMNGGTGISKRDNTFDALAKMFDSPLPGFGELFRLLSYEEIGAAAMMSRAHAGIIGRTAVFSMPGSTNAVNLAMTKLILPQLGHIGGELRK